VAVQRAGAGRGTRRRAIEDVPFGAGRAQFTTHLWRLTGGDTTGTRGGQRRGYYLRSSPRWPFLTTSVAHARSIRGAHLHTRACQHTRCTPLPPHCARNVLHARYMPHTPRVVRRSVPPGRFLLLQRGFTHLDLVDIYALLPTLQHYLLPHHTVALRAAKTFYHFWICSCVLPVCLDYHILVCILCCLGPCTHARPWTLGLFCVWLVVGTTFGMVHTDWFGNASVRGHSVVPLVTYTGFPTLLPTSCYSPLHPHHRPAT